MLIALAKGQLLSVTTALLTVPQTYPLIEHT